MNALKRAEWYKRQIEKNTVYTEKEIRGFEKERKYWLKKVSENLKKSVDNPVRV